VQWRRETDDTTFVPLFICATHLTYALPPPATFTQVPIRVLLATGGDQTYIVNPLSEAPFELQETQRALLRRYIAEAHHDTGWPSRHAP